MRIQPSTPERNANRWLLSWQKGDENASNAACGFGAYRPPFDWQRERASERHIPREFKCHPGHEPQIRLPSGHFQHGWRPRGS